MEMTASIQSVPSLPPSSLFSPSLPLFSSPSSSSLPLLPFLPPSLPPKVDSLLQEVQVLGELYHTQREQTLALLCQDRREREERARREAIQREKEGETQISLLEQLSVLGMRLGYILCFSSCGENCVTASPGAGVCARECVGATNTGGAERRRDCGIAPTGRKDARKMPRKINSV